MRYLVVSDTHGRLDPVIDWARGLPWSGDGIIHAGDFFRDGTALADALHLPLWGAQGNNDRDPDAPWESVWEIPNWRIGVIHGHQWPPSRRRSGLVEWARSRDCDIVIYGHTHVPEIQCEGGIWRINAGAVHAPRQQHARTVLTLDLAANLHYTWHTLM